MAALPPNQQRYLLHGLFWFVYIVLWFIGISAEMNPLKALLCAFIISLGVAPFVYFNLIYGIPRLLWKGRYINYALFFVGVCIAGIVVNHQLYHLMARLGAEMFGSANPHIFISTGIVPVILFLSTSLKMLKNSLDQQQLNRQLENQQLQTELNFLKTQVNPHFLFNTLNNLYSLALTKDDRAPDIVLKLSSILRYMLYECNEKIVYLNKEIEYLQNYIELEELRQGNSNYIRLRVSGNTDRRMIAPLLFTPLLENAIKHGLNKTVEHAWVHIELKIENEELQFEIKNSKSAKLAAQSILPVEEKTALGKTVAKKSGGIGLINVKRRLELLYPFKHSFGITETPDTYKVILRLNLEE